MMFIYQTDKVGIYALQAVYALGIFVWYFHLTLIFGILGRCACNHIANVSC